MKTLRTIIIGILTLIATMVVCKINTTANAETCPTCLPDAFNYVDFDSNTYGHYYNSDTGTFDIDYDTACEIVEKQFEYYTKHNHTTEEETISPVTATTTTSDTTTVTSVTTTVTILTDTNMSEDTNTTIITTSDSTIHTDTATLTTANTTTSEDTTTTDIITTTSTTTLANTTTTTSTDTNTTAITTNTDITSTDTTTTTDINITTSGNTNTTTTNTNITTSKDTTTLAVIPADTLKKLLADIKIYIDNNNSITIDYKFKDIYKYMLTGGQHHITIDIYY